MKTLFILHSEDRMFLLRSCAYFTFQSIAILRPPPNIPRGFSLINLLTS
jgi:hypothetical protein